MAKFPVKKSRPKNPPSGHAQKKHRRIVVKPVEKDRGWMLAGFDLSPSSLAGAAVGYDRTLDKLKGPVYVSHNFQKGIHYFEKLKILAKGFEFVLDLQAQLGLSVEMDQVWIAQEEPFPIAMMRQGSGKAFKQQAELSGAFLGGLVRYGFDQVFQISNMDWRSIVAADLGITTHHSKWRSAELAQEVNCHFKNSGKWRSKQWALGPKVYGSFPEEIPEWPDMIQRKDEKIPRPEGSTARAVQPDDRYDALAIMDWLYKEVSELGLLKVKNGLASP